jgi:hypothetical protein
MAAGYSFVISGRIGAVRLLGLLRSVLAERLTRSCGIPPALLTSKRGPQASVEPTVSEERGSLRGLLGILLRFLLHWLYVIADYAFQWADLDCQTFLAACYQGDRAKSHLMFLFIRWRKPVRCDLKC